MGGACRVGAGAPSPSAAAIWATPGSGYLTKVTGRPGWALANIFDKVSNPLGGMHK